LFLQVDANKKNDALLVSDIQRNKEKYALLTDPEQKLATLAIITQQEEALNSNTGETFLNELLKETKIKETAAQLGLTADKISDMILNKDEAITKLVNDTSETIKEGIDAAADVAQSFFAKREQANSDVE
jgi:plasmid maintenance system antidote protein VapI